MRSDARTTPTVSAASAPIGDKGLWTPRSQALPAHSTEKIRTHIQALRAQLRAGKGPATDPQSDPCGFTVYIGPPIRSHRPKTAASISSTHHQVPLSLSNSPSSITLRGGISGAGSALSHNLLIESSLPMAQAWKSSGISLPHRGPQAKVSNISTLSSVSQQRTPAPLTSGPPGVDQIRHTRQLVLVSALSAAIAFGMSAAAGRPS